MFTYAKLAKTLIDLPDIDWEGQEDLKNTGLYGLETLIAFVVNCGIVIALGIITGMWRECFFYTFAWGSVRVFAGGKHETNHVRCIAVYTMTMFAVIGIGRYLALYGVGLSLAVPLQIGGLALNLLYAGRKRADREEAIRYKKKVAVTWGIQFLLVLSLAGMAQTETETMSYLLIMTGAVMAECLYLLPVWDRINR